jgi:flavodoxin
MKEGRKMELKGKKILVAYFSKKGSNYFDGKILSLKVGNTEIVAKEIARQTGGELFEIAPEKEYEGDYRHCCDVAQKELQQKARPALKQHLDASAFDVIFLGSPTWWGTLAMPVYTFIEENNLFKGKTVVPFCTHEGSGLGNIMRDLKRECPQATVKEGLPIKGSTAASCSEAVSGFLKE